MQYPEEDTRCQSLREKRRCIHKAQTMNSRRAAFSKENKNAERSRIRKQRAKLTKEEAATDNKRATNIWQIARALAAEGEVSKTVVEKIIVNTVSGIIATSQNLDIDLNNFDV